MLLETLLNFPFEFEFWDVCNTLELFGPVKKKWYETIFLA